MSILFFFALLLPFSAIQAQLHCGSSQTCADPVGIGGQNNGIGGYTYGLTVSHFSNQGGGIYVTNLSNNPNAKGIRIGISDGAGLYSSSTSGKGVWAVSTSGTGLYGQTATGYALHAKSTSTGLAAYLEGNAEVTGTLEANSLETGSLIADGGSSFHYGVAHFKAGTNRQLFVVPDLSNGGFNFLSQPGDLGIIFSDGLAGGAQNQSAGLVLGPWKAGHTGIRIASDGKVGIGVAQPQKALDVDGSIHVSGNIGIGINNPTASLHILGAFKMRSISSGLNEFEINDLGEVRCRKINVDTDYIPDYVFAPDYPLLSLEELKIYIETYRHLPGIKSEASYMEEGSVDVGELQLNLLEKVEELTLYVIALQEKIEQLEKVQNSQAKPQLEKSDSHEK